MKFKQAILLFCSLCAFFQAFSLLAGQNYYFDSESGDDQYPINTKTTPWKTLDRINALMVGPGDSILLRAGGSWKGQVRLRGSGNEAFPAVLSSYGDGPKPVLDGDGSIGAVLTLKEQRYWHITNLEITNQAPDEASRLGILITAGSGQWQHIYLKDLYIHDISGRYSFKMIGKNTGGIGIIGENDARFDDILIEGCEICHITRVGIFTNGNAGIRGDRPITNLVIRNNRVSYCAGDGMIIRYAYQPLIEYNVAFENHNAPEDLVEFGVAIWVRSTDEALIQYNEVSYTRGKKDGQAFDADLDAFRTVVQYNYSHHNEGGFMLVYGSSSDAIVRYNISQDDGSKGKHILDFPIWTNPRGSGIFHNNVFYMGQESEAVLIDEALSSARFYNNIVINEGNGALFIPSDDQTATFSHNSLAGYAAPELAVNAHPVKGNPGLLNPGSGGFGFESLEGYRIAPSSPCISAGIAVSQMKGDYWRKEDFTDFWGTETDPWALDVGVHQPPAPSSRFP